MQIYIFEHAQSNKQQNWFVSRNQPYDDVLMTENAVAAFWFTKKEAAENFFENCHHNRFREPCFPTPRGYEAFYVPLQSTPTMSKLVIYFRFSFDFLLFRSSTTIIHLH